MPTLDTLPPEILFSILSFSSPFNPTIAPRHPLYTIAATNHYLRSIVEEYAKGLLKQHAHFTPKNTSSLIHRRQWLKWLSTICWFCRKPSVRKAILDPATTCCMKCDRKFPKMTMTNASTKHGLSKLDLFTPNPLHPNLPSLTVGVYMCMGSHTVMLSEPDVLARKKYIYDLLGTAQSSDPAYLKRRVSAHERIIKHMDRRLNLGQWVRRRPLAIVEGEAIAKSMRTEESREKYVVEGLEREWAAMGIRGGSEESAIELD
ncbi:uncharacterized protein BDR25DRAFT_273165 [Lindgomyces ingoldianus]|uniref:Uncharacterized protein n=1 Tax=Lindgomyces ingoldianus TaxID=673940 RepID=A0ACB6QAB2_9PLEO|nr:uncharacterized protein BDR25DRAFT_273165 [Lindgomyces ingoldianus]KAF2463317.1 hypothetical protein BDR25DRAFT_273165 [Lindgomyces ingoldianus]